MIRCISTENIPARWAVPSPCQKYRMKWRGLSWLKKTYRGSRRSIYNLLSSSVNRFKILEYGIRHYDRDIALGFIAKAQSVYEEISVEDIYSEEAALAYPLLDKHTLHFIILLKIAPPDFIYSFIHSERFRSFPDDEKQDYSLVRTRFQRFVSRIFSF